MAIGKKPHLGAVPRSDGGGEGGDKYGREPEEEVGHDVCRRDRSYAAGDDEHEEEHDADDGADRAQHRAQRGGYVGLPAAVRHIDKGAETLAGEQGGYLAVLTRLRAGDLVAPREGREVEAVRGAGGTSAGA